MLNFLRRSSRLFAIYLGALLAFANAGDAQAEDRSPSTTTPSESNRKANPDWYARCEARVAALKGKPCDIIFIGDSLTDGFSLSPTPKWDLVGKAVWDRYYANRNALNFGVAGDTTGNVLWRLDHLDIRSFRPKVAVILIGTNNNFNTPEQIAAGVKAVVTRTQGIFPGAKIILISILPNARATQKMADANKLIAAFADNRTVFYFDLASKMPPEGGSWRGLGRDKLHLTSAAYENWAAEMEPLLSKLLVVRGGGTP